MMATKESVRETLCSSLCDNSPSKGHLRQHLTNSVDTDWKNNNCTMLGCSRLCPFPQWRTLFGTPCTSAPIRTQSHCVHMASTTYKQRCMRTRRLPRKAVTVLLSFCRFASSNGSPMSNGDIGAETRGGRSKKKSMSSN